MQEVVLMGGFEIRLRRLTVAETATVTFRASKFPGDRERASAELLAAALSYGVDEAPEIGKRPVNGWGEDEMQKLAELIGTGPWIELGNKIVADSVHLGSLRGKSAAPSASAPQAGSAPFSAQMGSPTALAPAGPDA